MFKLYKRKTKEWVTIKEFFKQWKQGLQNITPLQQCVTVQFGHIISGVGIIWGIVFSIILGYWWMAIILIGGLIVLGVQYLGNWQKKMILKQIEGAMKVAELEQINSIDKEENIITVSIDSEIRRRLSNLNGLA